MAQIFKWDHHFALNVLDREGILDDFESTYRTPLYFKDDIYKNRKQIHYKEIEEYLDEIMNYIKKIADQKKVKIDFQTIKERIKETLGLILLDFEQKMY
jgi:hypothetical protein